MRFSEESVNVGINEAHIVLKVSLGLCRGGVAGKRIHEVWIKVQLETVFYPDIIIFLIAEETPGRCTSSVIVSNLRPNFAGELLTGTVRPVMYPAGICPVISLRKCDS